MENTLMIFSADHGDLCNDYYMRQKGPFPYKAQLGIPMLLMVQGRIPEKVHSDMLVSNLDIPATVLQEATGQYTFACSRSMIQMMKDVTFQRKELFSEFCDSVKIISDRAFRFSYYPFSGEKVLFRLEDETTNLAQDREYAPIVQEYMGRIIDYLIVAKGILIEAQYLTPKVQKGMRELLPDFEEQIPLAFPIPEEAQRDRLRKEFLNAEIL